MSKETSLVQVTNSDTGDATPPSTVHPNIPQVTMSPPSTVHPNIPQFTMSPTSTMHHSIPQVTMFPPSTIHPNIPQVTMSPPSTIHPNIPQVTMSPPSTMHHSIPQVTMPPPSTMATTTLPLNTTSHVTIDIGDFQPQIQSTSPKVIYSLPNPPHTYGTSSLNSAANNFIPCSQSPIVTSSFEHSNLFQQSQIFTSGSECNPTSIQVNPLTATPSHPPTVCLYPCNSSLQSANNPSTYPTYTRVIGEQPVVSTRSYVNSNFPNKDSTISLKRMSLPTFSGLRRDWPEFKAVWKSIAETSSYNKTALAHELKRSVKGEAKLRIKSVFITKPEAYDIMWEKLELHYEDTSASVQAALEGLRKLKPVKEEDYKGLVELVDEIESAYSQLDELKRLSTLTMRDVDFISELLPTHLKVDWRRKYRDLSPDDKLQPFKFFMTFLERERSVVARLAENQQPKKRERWSGYSNHVEGGNKSQWGYYKCAFPTHRKDTIKHTTEQCKEFNKLPISGKEEKYELLKQVNACFKCFGNHKKQNCSKKVPCLSCGSNQHHPLLCVRKPSPPGHEDEGIKPPPDGASKENRETASYAAGSEAVALYPIYQANVNDSNKKVSVFCDGGSNASYITHRAAERINAKKVKKLSLDVTTMGNVEKTYNTWQYEFAINTSAGKRISITAFGMERITGPVSKLDPKVLVKLFPDYDPESLQRKSSHVDVLLGCDYFGLHPKQEEARSGDNLSIMSGSLGICLQGAHPDLAEGTMYDANLAKKIHDVNVKVETYKIRVDSHPEFYSARNANTSLTCLLTNRKCQHSAKTSKSFGSQREVDQAENFIQGEELGTEVVPKCGGCRCNKRPTVGHTYSFKEEQELKMIEENLTYDNGNQCWITSYPWLIDPHTQQLPDCICHTTENRKKH